MTDTSLDLLAVGPHPDDVELFCGGTVARLVQLGYRVGILDLTHGELASNGTPADRQGEAKAAAEVLGLVLRENLALPDGGLMPGTDDDQVHSVAKSLRRLKPEFVIAPWFEARHPDHSAAGHLLRRAIFLSGLKRYRCDGLEAHRPRRTWFYQNRHRFRPSFVVDVSSTANTKMKAIRCHRSQVAPTDGVATLVGAANALQMIENRDRYYGSFIGVSHAEPFRVEETIGFSDPIKHFRDDAFGPAHAFEEMS